MVKVNRRWPVFGFLLALVLPAWSGVFYSKEEAMELAFGQGAQVEVLSLFPDDRQKAKIEEQAKTKLSSGLFSLYVGKSQGRILGYAAIETEAVRTKPETLMIVLNSAGELDKIVTLAFHEPPEYQPPERWYDQLLKKPLAELDFNKGIQGITGATLSTRAALNSVRRVMAIYDVMVKNKDKP